MTEEKPNIAEIYSRQNADEDFGINQKKIENVNNKEKNRVKKKTGKRKVSINRAKAKFFDLYYGHPARDMRLICVTGTTGKTTVAHFIHQILREKGERVAVLASEDEIKIGILHKFLSDAWKAGVKYVVVTAPMDSLAKDIFAGLKIHIAIATNSH